jgi:hypothetical protein
MGQQHAVGATGGGRFGAWAPAWVVGFTLLLTLTVVPTAADERVNSKTTRLVPHQGEPLTQYRAFRRMHARSERFNQEGWLDAWTELDEGGFRFEVVSERGSDYVRNKVLKAVLKREQEILADGKERGALTEENYVFSEPKGEPGSDGVLYILLKPKRKDVMLVEGRMVLAQDTGELMRVEGRLAKNPSFWTTLVNITRHFARVDGVRVCVSTESVAKLKFAGQSRLDVLYEYESINGRPVSLAAREVLAARVPGN